MPNYHSSDYDPQDPEAKIKAVIGDKLIGFTLTSDRGIIEIRTKGDLTSAEIVALKNVLGKEFTKTAITEV